MNCSKCHQSLPTLSIRGVKHRAVKKTCIPKRYIDISDDEVLYVMPVPMLIVTPQKGAALQRKPTKATIAGQP